MRIGLEKEGMRSRISEGRVSVSGFVEQALNENRIEKGTESK